MENRSRIQVAQPHKGSFSIGDDESFLHGVERYRRSTITAIAAPLNHAICDSHLPEYVVDVRLRRLRAGDDRNLRRCRRAPSDTVDLPGVPGTQSVLKQFVESDRRRIQFLGGKNPTLTRPASHPRSRNIFCALDFTHLELLRFRPFTSVRPGTILDQLKSLKPPSVEL
jgi:hypothetical protein